MRLRNTAVATLLAFSLAVATFQLLPAKAAEASKSNVATTAIGSFHRPQWFNRRVSHWGEVDDAFIDYVIDVKPQQAQAGFFGPEYYSARGYMLEMGAQKNWAGIGGGRLDQEWWKGAIARAHASNIKVLGQFSMGMVYGEPTAGRGWFGYFDKQWEEAKLGPKPLKADGTPVTAIELMQHTGAERSVANLVIAKDYKVEGGAEYEGCPSNPYWRETLKRFVKAGIELGLDGFTIVFPHKANCTCEFCQLGFKKHLTERYSAAQIQEKFGIADVATHRFETLNGWFEPEDASPLRLEQLKWTQLMLRDCLKEVFLDYGRKLKPDLIVGQWNHTYRSSMAGPGQIPGTFAVLNADERGVLPTDLWAKDEDFVWYSIGARHLYYKPEAGEFGQFSLEHKYFREAGRGLPQAVKLDDGQNIRMYIAEAVAHGGFGYARGPNYRDPATQEAAKNYFAFLAKNEELYRPIESYADVALIYPRTAVHRGDKSALLDFKNLGRILTRAHVSFDVVIDEQLTPERKKKYRTLLYPQADKLTPEDAANIMALKREAIVDGPLELVSVLWQQPAKRRILLHLVNYKRDLAKVTPALSGAANERPVALTGINASIKLPRRSKVKSVTLLSPDGVHSPKVAFIQKGDTVTFTVGKVLVYSVVSVEFR